MDLEARLIKYQEILSDPDVPDDLGFSSKISDWFDPRKDMLCSLDETIRNPHWQQMTDARREASKKRREGGY